MTVLFVGGVHGVGKSTCCGKVAQTVGCLHVTASDIIRRAHAGAIASSGKLVADVEGNQSLLVRGFLAFQHEVQGTSILLDGHFAMRDSNGDIQPVAADVFNALGIDHLVCLVDEPHAIEVRMSQRDGQAPANREIADLQNAELQNARWVASSLDLPFTLLRSGDVEGLRRLVSIADNSNGAA